MDQRALVSVSDPHQSTIAVASGARETAHTRFRSGDEFPLAHHAGPAAAGLGPDAAEIAGQLALRLGRVRFSGRVAPGAEAGAAAAAAVGEPVIAISAADGYELWADT